MGVSLTGCVGNGLAKGFGGPDAPADSSADAEGDGGGSTTELRGAVVGVLLGFRGEFDSPVALPPPSDAPSAGICTVSLGPRGLAPLALGKLLFLDGGGGKAASDVVGAAEFRPGSAAACDLVCGGEVPGRPGSAECALAASPLACDCSANEAKCCDKMDLFSSMGVKML